MSRQFYGHNSSPSSRLRNTSECVGRRDYSSQHDHLQVDDGTCVNKILQPIQDLEVVSSLGHLLKTIQIFKTSAIGVSRLFNRNF